MLYMGYRFIDRDRAIGAWAVGRLAVLGSAHI